MSDSGYKVAEISALSVRYGTRTAVENISLTLRAGQSFGLLGLNGAGKTTTIRALLGMVQAYSGTVELFGEKPGSLKSLENTGFAPEDGAPPDFLTTLEFLSFSYSLKRPRERDRLETCRKTLDWFELAENKRVQDLSKGMNRRLVLAQAFLGNPKLLILDEPLNGLDPLMIIKLRDKIDQYRSAGGTVLYCSHILSEVERCCSDVLILREGRVSYNASVIETKKTHGDVEQAFAKYAGKA